MKSCVFQGAEPEQSLYEMSQRFGFEPDLSNDVIQERLKELQEQTKKKILTEMKIKEGAENLRKATSDKKAQANVNSIVKQANSKLEELNEELQEVNAYLLMTNSNNITPGKWEMSGHRMSLQLLHCCSLVLPVVFTCM